MKVGVVLINFNKSCDTLECIKSLKMLNYRDIEIIVIDNNSTVEIPEALAGDSEINFIKLEENLGFGGGNNIGYRLAIKLGCQLVWILNNDTIVMPDTLDRLVLEMCKDLEHTAIVGGKLYFSDTRKLQALGGGHLNYFFGISPLNKRIGERIDFISGACMLINPKIVGLNPFDESFFMYWEDADLSLRLKRKGYKLLYASEAIVFHKESSSLGKYNPVLERYYGQSMVLFFRRNYSKPQIPIASGAVLRSSRRILSGNFTAGKAFLSAVFEEYNNGEKI